MIRATALRRRRDRTCRLRPICRRLRTGRVTTSARNALGLRFFDPRRNGRDIAALGRTRGETTPGVRKARNNRMPLLRIGVGVGLELEIRRHGHFLAEFAARRVFALDGEFGAVDGPDDAVGQVERALGGRVTVEVLVVFVFVQVAGGGQSVVTAAVALEGAHGPGFAFERAFDKGFGGAVVFVREGDGVHGLCGRVGVDQEVCIALGKAAPFEIHWNVQCGGSDVAEHGLLSVGLAAHKLVVGGYGGLDGL